MPLMPRGQAVSAGWHGGHGADLRACVRQVCRATAHAVPRGLLSSAGSVRRRAARPATPVPARPAAFAGRRCPGRCGPGWRPGAADRSPSLPARDGRAAGAAGAREAGRDGSGEPPSSSVMSCAVSTSFAPWRISAWQPRDSGEWMEPGMAKTSRPHSPARRAVMSEPLCPAASTTSTPRARPATMRLRLGKCCGSAPVPSGSSDTSAPCAAMRCASSRWRAG